MLKIMQEHGFPVPNAVDCNRHCVIMSLVQGYPFVQVKHLQNPETVFEKIIGIVVRLAEHGLIHCDFNEFNIMAPVSPPKLSTRPDSQVWTPPYADLDKPATNPIELPVPKRTRLRGNSSLHDDDDAERYDAIHDRWWGPNS